MKPGDLIELVLDDEVLKGTLVQSPDPETIVLKLSNGYNVAVEKSRVRKTVLVSPLVEASVIKKPRQVEMRKGLPLISILHTGGTIASKVDYRTGGVVARFSPEEILAMFPELNGIANVTSRLVSNMWSEDMRLAHYNVMAMEVRKEVESGADGIIITHGTDTLHYTSAALSFALQGLGIPVILVGAQRSSDRGSTDARLNLLSAAYFIANSDFAGVAICMHETISDTSCLILPALKSRKMHTSRRDAFRPINALPIARVCYDERGIEFKGDYRKRDKKSRLGLKLFNEGLKIGILKAHPNMYPEEFSSYRDFDGLVIEGYALGQLPINAVDEKTNIHSRNLEELRLLCAKMPVVMSSQSIYGRIQLDVYSTGRDIKAAGVLGHLSDMTPETAFIKLAWLLSNHSKDEIRLLIAKNLIGEIAERSEKEAFLI
ncbi:Glu-tRNA(Gln) amidotransferase subunit GatD [Candidatus Woesearchaeota archaeon]|nr:Glu-tRNA(Gln) amidotransferase subunit GatD [Candidatus Woesearchaeota archaeon]